MSDATVTPMPGPPTRRCPVCNTPFPVSTGRGRPRVYCCDECRWQAGHEAGGGSGRISDRDAEDIGRWLDRGRDWTADELAAWAEGGFGEPPL
jgi:hypothetical protein